ncbi:hypothetical protein AMAG_14341 [Allomyces macrogynus ATCC 38327]|uniref:Hsp70-like protein n=1 Tax=Allomyces macrogynus (strain ATCC 38327) TaxID=578462 RepID=A0A0L0T4R5_ALLM3|nr:hypothetical protein AMAG_14341 [Allomyces macrogynus ATCC 38327]|eukprot:KNE69803.1 hypothetical protein AMAG_14341 [Allomyces macrogynus ATCC 38327]
MGQTPSRIEDAQPVRHQVSLDFGTSHSGFALAKKGLPEALDQQSKSTDIEALERIQLDLYLHLRTTWPGTAEPYPKTRTALLYNANGKVVAWGNDAESKFLGMPKIARKNHIYIDRFKLFLDETRIHVSSEMGRLGKLGKNEVDVIADYLICLADTVRKEIVAMGALNEEWNPYHVRWCLTVPAQWTEKGKDKMRKAMHKAGLIRAANSSRLILCSEPLAGLLFTALSSQTHDNIQRGESVLIVDMGGGTVDLTAMRMSQTGFEERIPMLGETVGSTMLDDAFLEMLGDIVGKDEFKSLTVDNPQIKYKVRKAWELCKVAFDGEDRDYNGNIPLPQALVPACRRWGGEPVPGTGGATVDDGELYITFDSMTQLFEPVVLRIAKLVKQMLLRCQYQGIHIAHILCVGGFSRSKYLIKMLRAQLQEADARKFIVSSNGAAAILMGAPIYACRPELLRKQIAPLTYGIQHRSQYSFERHGPRNLVEDRIVRGCDGLDLVENDFNVVIRKGDTLEPGIVATQQYVSGRCENDSITFCVYVSTEENPLNTEKESCKKIGSFKIMVTPCKTTAERDSVEVTVSMKPSGLTLRAVNKRTNEEVDCQLSFHD